jgi:hypothetical protein
MLAAFAQRALALSAIFDRTGETSAVPGIGDCYGSVLREVRFSY